MHKENKLSKVDACPQHTMKITVTLVMIVCLLSAVDGTRIFPFHVKSHYNVYKLLLERLSARGHEIVAVTHFPQRIRPANFTDLDVSFALPNRTNAVPFPNVTI